MQRTELGTSPPSGPGLGMGALLRGRSRAGNEGPRIEARWPLALAVLAVGLIFAFLPARVRLFPSWSAYAAVLLLLLPMTGVWWSGARAPWPRIERVAALVFGALMEAATLATLLYLILQMLERPTDLSGRQLLATSIAAWVATILAFSVVYWQIDRGGPESRANDAGARPDWLFPQAGAGDEAPPDWRPTFVDYLFLSFSTATAFSATDALPLTPRAKLLVMAESAVSLATLVIVAARAINILGS